MNSQGTSHGTSHLTFPVCLGRHGLPARPILATYVSAQTEPGRPIACPKQCFSGDRLLHGSPMLLWDLPASLRDCFRTTRHIRADFLLKQKVFASICVSHLFDISCCFLLFDCFCFIYVWFRFFFADTLTKFSDTTWANGALSLGIYNAFGKGLALGRHKVMTSVAMTSNVPIPSQINQVC